ncbi:hypothetical protein BaRGS_00010765, partial [Batillaria attramentaria]
GKQPKQDATASNFTTLDIAHIEAINGQCGKPVDISDLSPWVSAGGNTPRSAGTTDTSFNSAPPAYRLGESSGTTKIEDEDWSSDGKPVCHLWWQQTLTLSVGQHHQGHNRSSLHAGRGKAGAWIDTQTARTVNMKFPSCSRPLWCGKRLP